MHADGPTFAPALSCVLVCRNGEKVYKLSSGTPSGTPSSCGFHASQPRSSHCSPLSLCLSHNRKANVSGSLNLL